MKVLLFQPQIPQNTGNIVRTCAVTGSDLILVRPLGFQTTCRKLKRAGLDYWEDVSIEMIDDLNQYLELSDRPFTLFSSKAEKPYTSINYSQDHLLIFGSEDAGLPEETWKKWSSHFATIPMIPNTRCLNLSTSVGIVLYEAWRQQGFTMKRAELESTL